MTQRKRPRSDGLRLKRFLFKSGRHFGCDHAAKVFLQVHGKHAVVLIVINGDHGGNILQQRLGDIRFLACDGTAAQQQHKKAQRKCGKPER